MSRTYARTYTLTNDASAERFVGDFRACLEIAGGWTSLGRDGVLLSGAWRSSSPSNELTRVFGRERDRGGRLAACGITMTPNVNRGDLTLVCDGRGSWSALTVDVAAALVAVGERRRQTLDELTTARRRHDAFVASVYGSLRAAIEPYERSGTTGDADEYGGRLSDDRPMTDTRRFVVEGRLALACTYAELAAYARRGLVRSASYADTDLVRRGRAREATPRKTIPV